MFKCCTVFIKQFWNFDYGSVLGFLFFIFILWEYCVSLGSF